MEMSFGDTCLAGSGIFGIGFDAGPAGPAAPFYPTPKRQRPNLLTVQYIGTTSKLDDQPVLHMDGKKASGTAQNSMMLIMREYSFVLADVIHSSSFPILLFDSRLLFSSELNGATKVLNTHPGLIGPIDIPSMDPPPSLQRARSACPS